MLGIGVTSVLLVVVVIVVVPDVSVLLLVVLGMVVLNIGDFSKDIAL